MKKTIYLNAGHDIIRDPGAITQFGKEIDFNIKIRDALVPQLIGQGFKVVCVPDELGLRKSYKFPNQFTSHINDGLALSIHCNVGGGTGAEVFSFNYNKTSMFMGRKLIDVYCEETGLKNRGVKPDNLLDKHDQSGWIRKTNVWALLIECGFIDSIFDVKKLEDYQEIAKGITKGVCAIYNIKYFEKKPELEENKKSKALDEIIKVLKKYKQI